MQGSAAVSGDDQAIRPKELTVDAETLKCPMCGAPAATDASECEHCGARLATVACPSCFGLMFAGQKFCGHCGARADRVEAEDASQRCPRCRLAMEAIQIGGASLLECRRCGGLWVEKAALEDICRDREKQALVPGMGAPPAEEGTSIETVRYVPCPVCSNLMNRVNFANCSNVVVDVCKAHGTWFDRDELRRVVEFIRAGGLEAARTRQLAEIEEERKRLAAEKVSGAWDSSVSRSSLDYHECRGGMSLVGGLLRACMDRLED